MVEAVSLLAGGYTRVKRYFVADDATSVKIFSEGATLEPQLEDLKRISHLRCSAWAEPRTQTSSNANLRQRTTWSPPVNAKRPCKRETMHGPNGRPCTASDLVVPQRVPEPSLRLPEATGSYELQPERDADASIARLPITAYAGLTVADKAFRWCAPLPATATMPSPFSGWPRT